MPVYGGSSSHGWWSQQRYTPRLPMAYAAAAGSGQQWAQVGACAGVSVYGLAAVLMLWALRLGQRDSFLLATTLAFVAIVPFDWLAASWRAWVPRISDEGFEPPERSFGRARRGDPPPPIEWDAIEAARYLASRIPVGNYSSQPVPRYLRIKVRDGPFIEFDRALYPEAFATLEKQLATRGFLPPLEAHLANGELAMGGVANDPRA